MTKIGRLALRLLVAIALLLSLSATNGFSARPQSKSVTTRSRIGGVRAAAAGGNDDEPEKSKGFFTSFFEELDAFVDDATSRRLGGGAAFYGKRKSNFYGNGDKGRKMDRDMPDPTEDYQAPANGGYFKWMMDENGQMKPVTRMKEKVVERNPRFWDKVYDVRDEKE